jgi:hypothetical protein
MKSQIEGFEKKLSDMIEGKAGKSEIEGIKNELLDVLKKQGEEIDRAALTFKYQALLQQQELERVLLSLKQEQARQDATQTARRFACLAFRCCKGNTPHQRTNP